MKIKEANEISSFDAQVGHTCVNYGCVCIIEEKGEKKPNKRRGKGREREKVETKGTCTIIIRLLTNFVW